MEPGQLRWCLCWALSDLAGGHLNYYSDEELRRGQTGDAVNGRTLTDKSTPVRTEEGAWNLRLTAAGADRGGCEMWTRWREGLTIRGPRRCCHSILSQIPRPLHRSWERAAGQGPKMEIRNYHQMACGPAAKQQLFHETSGGAQGDLAKPCSRPSAGPTLEWALWLLARMVCVKR